MSDDSGQTHPDEGRLVTGREVAVPSQPRSVAAFTPEQVAAARGYADAVNGSWTIPRSGR